MAYGPAAHLGELLQGREFLVINTVNKVAEYYNSNELEDNRYTIYYNVTHPTVNLAKSSGYQRYHRDCDLRKYANTFEGDDHYLILAPDSANPPLLKISAVYPCNAYELPDELIPILDRDRHLTGIPRDVDEETQEYMVLYGEQLARNKPPKKSFLSRLFRQK